MPLPDPDELEHIGLTLYERKTLVALMLCGVADAATLCREGGIPTSKIYLAVEKLEGLGLVQVQPTRPKMFAALPAGVVVKRIVEIARERSERFAAQATALHTTFAGLRARVRGRQPFVDLALGVEGHIRRHLVPLAAARTRILSYMEAGDLMAIDAAVKSGFPILRRIAKNASEYSVDHRVVFGFSYQNAGSLVEFLKAHRQHLRQVTSVRYSGELGHPFHVVDEDTVILPLDHPFVKEGRFASGVFCGQGTGEDAKAFMSRMFAGTAADPKPRIVVKSFTGLATLPHQATPALVAVFRQFVWDLVDLAVLGNVVEKSGAWYTYKGTRLGQGRENAKQFLKDNPEICDRLEAAIRGRTDGLAEEMMAGPDADPEI